MSMESFIFIDGAVLWVTIALITFFILSSVFFSLRCLTVEIKNDRLTEDNAELYKELLETKDKLYKLGFKKQLEDMGDV